MRIGSKLKRSPAVTFCWKLFPRCRSQISSRTEFTELLLHNKCSHYWRFPCYRCHPKGWRSRTTDRADSANLGVRFVAHDDGLAGLRAGQLWLSWTRAADQAHKVPTRGRLCVAGNILHQRCPVTLCFVVRR